MDKSFKLIVGALVGLILLSAVFSAGVLVGHYVPSSAQLPVVNNFLPEQAAPGPVVSTESESVAPADVQTLFVPFWEAWDFVHSRYVDQPVDDVALMRGAIKGMMDAVGDKQTYYLPPAAYESTISQLSGEYEGIGAYVDTTGEYLEIISPIEGSPAEGAGLKPGDLIVAIDGEDMTGRTPEEARQKVLGPAGTQVILTIIRETEEDPLKVSIVRAKILIASATGKMLENDIAYVDINTFGDNTAQELEAVLDDLLAQNPQGVVIDLRNNGGGYLQTAIEVSSQFIEEGVVLYEQFGDGTRDPYSTLGNGRATNLPIVVLVNEGTASASEILAGALQDYERAQLVGVVTYGKGSVQIMSPLSGDHGAARVTIARWLTPDERLIEGIGLTPDFLVELTAEDIAAERDSQLDKAVEVLLGLIAQK